MIKINKFLQNLLKDLHYFNFFYDITYLELKKKFVRYSCHYFKKFIIFTIINNHLYSLFN